MFTVTGTVTHTLGVSNVLYSLNNMAYLPATTTNGWTNWSVVVTLSVGSNSISAFAIDTNGASSAIEKVKLTYVEVSPLIVQTNGGKAIITPNDNNVSLEIGKNYKLAVKGIDGFSLLDWTGGTNFLLSILTNKTTLSFTMVTNLVLVANMVDTEKPYLKITNWTSKFVATNEMFTVMGRATDNVAVASVNYSINGSTNNVATLAETSWSAPLTLSLGSNTFTVYAVDINGNVSLTNKINILRQPGVTKFEIVSNFVSYPAAQLGFDGSNYLVAYQVYSSSPSNSTAMGQFVSPAGKIIGVRLTLNPNGQNSPPYMDFDGSNYLVAWADFSQEASGVPLRGVFVSPEGTVGSVTTLSQSTSVADFSTVVYGGGVYLLTWADSQTTPDSIYGAFINTSGFNQSGDFLISTNAFQSEASGISAAFDQTNFLAVWYSATGDTCIKGCLVNPSVDLVGSPFVIYTNNLAAELSTISVTFDGTKYLVLFSTSAGSATEAKYHVLGRFVTTGGTVLTNQITVTSANGPQIAPSAAFDGDNYLISWNQGFNPSAINKSTTVNGQLFNSEGQPASSEFSLFTTLSGSQIPLWSPVLWDGSKFVLVGGLGRETTNSIAFTNSVIYGEFISP